MLLDGVKLYLPSPIEIKNEALDVNKDEEKITIDCLPTGPLVALAFKLEEGRFGQLTYLRLYSGTLKRGDWIVNSRTNKKIKVN